MPKVRIDEIAEIDDIEIIEEELDDETIEQGIEKFSRVRRTKMKDELARYKNKKLNKGRERGKNE
jgi:hypothetical protein